MRECISEPMNTGPLFIIRNNFPFALPLFFTFSHYQFRKYKNISFIAFHKPNHYNHIFYCLLLHCIFPRAISIFSGAIAFAYLLSVLYTYTHPVSNNHLVRLRTQSKFIYFAGCLKNERKDPCTHSSPRVLYKPSSHLHGENCASLCSTLYSWSLNLVEASSIFSGDVAGELVEGLLTRNSSSPTCANA
jgi:hypothetical protein